VAKKDFATALTQRVIAGLKARSAVLMSNDPVNPRGRQVSMDHRVKPGGDGLQGGVERSEAHATGSQRRRGHGASRLCPVKKDGAWAIRRLTLKLEGRDAVIELVNGTKNNST
jgi:hypothetical protein